MAYGLKKKKIVELPTGLCLPFDPILFFTVRQRLLLLSLL